MMSVIFSSHNGGAVLPKMLESLTRAEAPWLSDGQVRRLDPDNAGRITLARLRVAMAQDFTRADRDGSATLTPGRWPLD